MPSRESQWTPLEHCIFRLFSENQWTAKSCVVAVSGGADSVALLRIMQRIGSSLKLNLSAAHVHHGMCSSAEQLSYRNKAEAFVRELCHNLAIPLFCVRSDQLLSSEASLRKFRHIQIEQIRVKCGAQSSLWAHHQDDFLETQMMRLIRGTGETGITPMTQFRGSLLRPLLKTSKQEILSYLEQQSAIFCEDPSNLDLQPLRNWIRQSWLPQVEEKCPGALKSLARSLDLLQARPENEDTPSLWLESTDSAVLSRPVFLSLSPSQKKQALAQSLRRIGQFEFTQNQLLEVMKRLDRAQTVQQFICAKMVWSLSKDVISVTPPFVVNEK